MLCYYQQATFFCYLRQENRQPPSPISSLPYLAVQPSAQNYGLFPPIKLHRVEKDKATQLSNRKIPNELQHTHTSSVQQPFHCWHPCPPGCCKHTNLIVLIVQLTGLWFQRWHKGGLGRSFGQNVPVINITKGP